MTKLRVYVFAMTAKEARELDEIIQQINDLLCAQGYVFKHTIFENEESWCWNWNGESLEFRRKK